MIFFFLLVFFAVASTCGSGGEDNKTLLCGYENQQTLPKSYLGIFLPLWSHLFNYWWWYPPDFLSVEGKKEEEEKDIPAQGITDMDTSFHRYKLQVALRFPLLFCSFSESTASFFRPFYVWMCERATSLENFWNCLCHQSKDSEAHSRHEKKVHSSRWEKKKKKECCGIWWIRTEAVQVTCCPSPVACAISRERRSSWCCAAFSARPICFRACVHTRLIPRRCIPVRSPVEARYRYIYVPYLQRRMRYLISPPFPPPNRRRRRRNRVRDRFIQVKMMNLFSTTRS